MSKVNIDGKDYDLESLSEKARTQVRNLQATEIELARTQALVAMLTTARAAYAQRLHAAMEEEPQEAKQ